MYLALSVFGALLPSCWAAAEEFPIPAAAAAALASDDQCSGADGDGCALEALQLRGVKQIYAWNDYLASASPVRSNLLQEEMRSNHGYKECHMDDSSKCPLSGLDGKPTLVYPGGKTRCFDGSPYAFAVVPGDKDKLLFFFEGGGACWEANGNVVLDCTMGIDYGIQTTGLGLGIQNFSRKDNVFRSYTIVEPIYCAGDAFMGTKTQHWKGKEYYQHGYENALSAVEWAKENIHGELSSLVISGFSAGSLGSMVWAGTLLRSFKHSTAKVLLDSYAGVFPKGVQGVTMKEWGACDAELWTPKVKADCLAGTMTVQETFEKAMDDFPHVAFGNIQSKVDATQIAFYKGLAMSHYMMDGNGAGVSNERFYKKSLKVFEEYNSRLNYVEILVDGNQHCFTQDEHFYTATTAGLMGGQGEPLAKWVHDFISLRVASACSGLLEGRHQSSGTSFCDDQLTAKVLVLGK